MTTLDLGTFSTPLEDWQQPISCRELLAPTTVAEAVALAGDRDGSAYLAGGTHLVRYARFGNTLPEVLVWLGGVEELTQLQPGVDGVHIGASVVHNRVAEVAGTVGLVWAAAREIAGPAVRNLGTVGGNVIIDWDLVPALLASDARLYLATAGGVDTVALEGVHAADGTAALPAGALLTGMDVSASGGHWSYRKVGRRKAVSRAIAGVAVRLEVDDGQVTAARIAVGGSAVTSRRVADAETLLVGHPLDDAPPDGVGELVRTALADVDGDVEGPGWYVRDIAHILTERALADALIGQETP